MIPGARFRTHPMQDRPMRIIHLLKHCERGNGHVHVAVDLACEQAARGHRVTFASRGGTYVPLLEERGVHHVVVAQSASHALHGMGTLLRLMIRERPDIVHAHMMGSAAMGWLATRCCGGALVTTVHNSFDGHSGLMRLGDRVVAVSDAEKRLLLQRGYAARRLAMVHNGPLGSAREGLAPDALVETVPRPCIMTLSGLHGRKRVGDVIAAFAAVRDVAPDWHLVIVGEGPDEAILKQQCETLAITDRVTFAGRTLNPAPLLRQASIFMNLAEAEPFGLVLVEARAAGCAIVAAAVGGMPEVLDGGAAGRLVPVGDVAAAASVLRELTTSPEALQHAREAGRLRPGQFTVAAMAEGYDGVYRDVMATRAVAPAAGPASLAGRS